MESLPSELSADTGPENDPLLGVVIDGRFRIVSRIGKGAMGRVYRAVQEPLNRAVALKVLDTTYGAGRDTSFRQRFLVEASLTAKLSHPNTVRIFDYGYSRDGLFFLAMEHLDGETLESLLKRGALSWRRAIPIAQQMARALREAHDMGVVHRDLKPANVMLIDADDETDHVKVLDFGLVKSFIEGQELEGRAITQQGMLVGSPPYMAPEQGDVNRADPRSDIYSLGCVLFEMLTGKPPFTGSVPIQIILKHVNEPVPPMVTPVGLEAIPTNVQAVVARCLEKSPMDRFQSMDELLQQMNAIVSPIMTPVMELPALAQPAPSPVLSKRNLTLLGVGFLASLVLGVTATAWLMKPAPKAVASLTVPAANTEVVKKTVAIVVNTDPVGVLVRMNGQTLGVTPLTYQVEAPSNGQVAAELALSKDGFVPLTVSATGFGPRIEVSQRLQKVARIDKVEPPVATKKVETTTTQSVLPPKKQPASKLEEEDEPVVDDLKRPK